MQTNKQIHFFNLRKRHRRLPVRTRYFLHSLFKQAILMLLPVLFLGCICIRYLTTEARKTITENNYQELYQLNSKMDANFTVMDNIYLYLITNSTVNSGLRKAYNEPSLSLSSIRLCQNVGNIFSNYIYANSYLYDLKIYYYNPYNRVLSMKKHGIIQADKLRDQEWIFRSQNLSQDSFLEGVTLPETSTEPEKWVLRQYRKIYSSLNANTPVGCIVIDYDLDKIDQYIHSSGFPDMQTMVFTDKNGNIVYQSDNKDYSQLSTLISNTDPAFSTSTLSIEGSDCFISAFNSERTDGLNYISITPNSALFASVRNLLAMFSLYMILAVALSALLALYKTRKDFSHLVSIFDILENPEDAVQKSEKEVPDIKNPYDLIIYNLINLFLRQNYLTVLNNAQEARMQVLELTALQQQINPHFLHNTLNTIYWETIRLTGSENQCTHMITDLSSMMRYALGNPEQTVTLTDELEYLKEFLRIQSIRFQNKFSVVFDIDENVLKYQIRKILLQPLVENAIHHGIKPKDGHGTITISIQNGSDLLYFSVTDDGIGIPQDKLELLRNRLASEDDYSQHIGLMNVNRRLILSYGQDSALFVSSAIGKGTSVRFHILKKLL